MSFADKIKTLRLQKNINQDQASKEIGIAVSSLRNYENGRLPETEVLKRIKNYYNVPYEYLLDDNCENKSIESLSIGSELQLSDKSINTIKSFQSLYGFSGNKDTPTSFNYFLENFTGINNFLNELSSLQKNIIFYKDIIDLIHLSDLKTSILYYTEHDKNKGDEIINYFDNKLKNISALYQNNANDIQISEKDFDNLKEHYANFKKTLNTYSSKKTNFKDLSNNVINCIINIFNILIDIKNRLQKEIGYLKYSISNNMNNFLDNIENYNYYSNFNIYNCYYNFDEEYFDKKLHHFIMENRNIIINLTSDERNKYSEKRTKKDFQKAKDLSVF